jgi:L-malate glycosyltransferase
LHVHYAIPHASAAYFAMQILKKQGKDIPFITTLHGTDITLVGRDPKYMPVVTFSMNESSAITAVSENLKQETYKHFDIEKEIHVITNFVDTQRFQHSDKEHFKKMLAPSGERILAHVSNFRKVKRVDDVIRVFEKIRKVIPSKLLMIGDGPERPNTEELARHLEVCNDVRFLGKQEQVDEILSITDLFILPSEYESFGLAALEAMACGVPVISTNTGGLPEINVPGVTGYLSDVGDIDNMAENAIKIIKNDSTLQQFKSNALEHTRNFERDKIVPLYENLYLQVIEEHKKQKEVSV